MLRAMRARALPIVVLSSMSGLVAVGCAYGEVRQVIRAQFASELNCSDVVIKRRDSWYAFEGPDQYKVMGCGEVRTYTCAPHQGLTSYDKPACPWVKGDADAPTHTADASEDAAMDAPPTAPAKPAAAAPAMNLRRLRYAGLGVISEDGMSAGFLISILCGAPLLLF